MSSNAENHPVIFDRYVKQYPDKENGPRRTVRRYHGRDVNLWLGKVHVDDIEGWVENTRLKHYLRRWQSRRADNDAVPTTDDIYQIMIEADEEESSEASKPFHIDRLAKNIVRNQVQEPVVIHVNGGGKAVLWDGNRRFFATMHIMRDEEYIDSRVTSQWIPAYVHEDSGEPEVDQEIQHKILTELNFIEKDHIPWPSYVKAGEVHRSFEALVGDDQTPAKRRSAKEKVAKEFGLSGWRKADRWIKMYALAQRFKNYCEDNERDEVVVELKIQEKFEYFDELTKPSVWGSIKDHPDNQEMVFEWLWDDKFKAFPDVRYVPRILNDPVAIKLANSPGTDAVKDAIAAVISNDPIRVKSKEAANEKIQQFADWLDSFKREDFRQLEPKTLESLKSILTDVTRMLSGLLNPAGEDK